HLRGLPVHHPPGPPHRSPEGLTDRLVAEADPEDGQLAAQGTDQRHADARLGGSTRSGAEHHRLRTEAAHAPHLAGFVAKHRHRLRPEAAHALHGDGVVAKHLCLRPERLQRLRKVEGEGVVVVDEDDHGSASSPAMATSAARSLCAVSWYSAAGTLSCTIPAPAWKRSLCPASATARMMLARSMSPSEPP